MAYERAHVKKQRGVVLFIALIALVVMLLAVVALIRSVDTSTLIAGNLAFKQAATTSADAGTEAAIVTLTAMEAAGTFNNTNAANGYYAFDDPAAPLDLFADANWDAITAIPEVTDASGNRVRYIIQRMCRSAGVLSPANCMFSATQPETSRREVTGYQKPKLEIPSQSPIYRITIRVTGPRNTVSHIQSFVY